MYLRNPDFSGMTHCFAAWTKNFIHVFIRCAAFIKIYFSLQDLTFIEYIIHKCWPDLKSPLIKYPLMNNHQPKTSNPKLQPVNTKHLIHKIPLYPEAKDKPRIDIMRRRKIIFSKCEAIGKINRIEVFGTEIGGE